jgi:hypothetical protein
MYRRTGVRERAAVSGAAGVRVGRDCCAAANCRPVRSRAMRELTKSSRIGGSFGSRVGRHVLRSGVRPKLIGPREFPPHAPIHRRAMNRAGWRGLMSRGK